MEKLQSYFYVGPEEILERIDEKYEGKKITQISNIDDWIKESNQKTTNEQIIATFIINEERELVISDRHSEHVVCAGGKDVLSAGEITFNFDTANVYVGEISNQSTGYCPKTASWKAVDIALNKIKIEHPDFFTRAFEFRYCNSCQNKNIIKDEIYECDICHSDLDIEWNIDKMKRNMI